MAVVEDGLHCGLFYLSRCPGASAKRKAQRAKEHRLAHRRLPDACDCARCDTGDSRLVARALVAAAGAPLALGRSAADGRRGHGDRGVEHAHLARAGLRILDHGIPGRIEDAGTVGFRESSWEPEVCELVYSLDPAWWGQGLATEVARAALDWAFATHRWPRIVAATDTPNVASARVLERIGMRLVREGVLEPDLPTLFFEIGSR